MVTPTVTPIVTPILAPTSLSTLTKPLCLLKHFVETQLENIQTAPGHFASRSQQHADPSTEAQHLLAVVAQEQMLNDEVPLIKSSIGTCHFW
jgi:hypothetical protein